MNSGSNGVIDGGMPECLLYLSGVISFWFYFRATTESKLRVKH